MMLILGLLDRYLVLNLLYRHSGQYRVLFRLQSWAMLLGLSKGGVFISLGRQSLQLEHGLIVREDKRACNKKPCKEFCSA